MESRHNPGASAGAKASPLPHDYIQMVRDVFTNHFDEGLKALAKLKPSPRFEVGGAIYLNEVVLCVSLGFEGELAATTAYASADFDPKASAPTVQEILATCVDALGAVLEQIIQPNDPVKLEQLSQASLSAFEEIPFQWTQVEVERQKIFVKVDKSNPKLDEAADEWLRQNDPELAEREKREQEETEKLFVTGPGKKTLH